MHINTSHFILWAWKSLRKKKLNHIVLTLGSHFQEAVGHLDKTFVSIKSNTVVLTLKVSLICLGCKSSPVPWDRSMPNYKPFWKDPHPGVTCLLQNCNLNPRQLLMNVWGMTLDREARDWVRFCAHDVSNLSDDKMLTIDDIFVRKP